MRAPRLEQSFSCCTQARHLAAATSFTASRHTRFCFTDSGLTSRERTVSGNAANHRFSVARRSAFWRAGLLCLLLRAAKISNINFSSKWHAIKDARMTRTLRWEKCSRYSAASSRFRAVRTALILRLMLPKSCRHRRMLAASLDQFDSDSKRLQNVQFQFCRSASLFQNWLP